jgi:hypothetical protein
MCERANKCSGKKKITGKADKLYKQGERGHSPTGKGIVILIFYNNNNIRNK